MEVSKNKGTPIQLFKDDIPYKPSVLGYPHFSKTHTCVYIYTHIYIHM